ncbi:hypothetical protein [Ochrovirga pacifica]|uniref:hypothetical protein n=1 Tax=Ochrovirga pacifica TaxID=1042376 RepID=UPI0002557768|nr:hypothetical protein [Ochrovirga pacifica]
MNLKKIVFVVCLIVSTTAFSQKWAVKQAEKLTEKLNTTLVATNSNLKLSAEQSEKITDIYKNLMVKKSEVKLKMEKEGTFTKKDFWKATFPQTKEANQVIRTLLTQPQKKAFNESLQKK